MCCWQFYVVNRIQRKITLIIRIRYGPPSSNTEQDFSLAPPLNSYSPPQSLAQQAGPGSKALFCNRLSPQQSKSNDDVEHQYSLLRSKCAKTYKGRRTVLLHASVFDIIKTINSSIIILTHNHNAIIIIWHPFSHCLSSSFYITYNFFASFV